MAKRSARRSVGPLDKCGEFIVAKLRDPAIDRADELLAGRLKSPATQALQAELARLTLAQQALVRRVVLQAVDSGLHDFLFAVGEAADLEEGMALVVGGKNVAELSDGLQGEPYGDEGWFARFSKHGPHRDPA